MSSRKNMSFNLILVITGVGLFLGRRIPQNIQLPVIIILASIVVWGFIKEYKNRNFITPYYIYITIFAVIFLYTLQLIGRAYLWWSENILFILLVLNIIPVIYAGFMGIITRLKDGTPEEVNRAKIIIVLLSIFITLSLAIFIKIMSM